jgi:uncharacterized protein (TIGR00369 family)
MHLKKKSIRFPSKDPEIFLSKVNRSPFYKTIKMQLEKTDRKGSLVRIKLNRKHNNVLGIVHGGVIASLIDSACSMSVIPYIGDDETIVTTGLQIQYYLLVASDDMVGRGRVVHYGRRVAYAEAEIRDRGKKIIAKGSASFLIIKKSINKGE